MLSVCTLPCGTSDKYLRIAVNVRSPIILPPTARFMAYVPGFTNDIFISYSHKDDQAVDGPGWVTDFHRHLSIEVEEALGEDVHIWRDKRITGATDFTKDLEKQIRGSAILLAVLSPGYVKSKWCDWELKGFAGSRRVGDLWVDTKCRAIKVIKRPPDPGTLQVLPETEGVKLFDLDLTDDVSYEMDWSSALYRQRLTVLGNDIKFILRAMFPNGLTLRPTDPSRRWRSLPAV